MRDQREHAPFRRAMLSRIESPAADRGEESGEGGEESLALQRASLRAFNGLNSASKNPRTQAGFGGGRCTCLLTDSCGLYDVWREVLQQYYCTGLGHLPSSYRIMSFSPVLRTVQETLRDMRPNPQCSR
jgi:hypothetical protein